MNTYTMASNMIPDLETFIERATNNFPKNSYISEPGFEFLYVRLSERYISGIYRNAIDIANVQASKPGNKAFTKLLQKIRKNHPELTIYIENVLTERFATRLLLMGFEPREHEPRCYYLLPNKELWVR